MISRLSRVKVGPENGTNDVLTFLVRSSMLKISLMGCRAPDRTLLGYYGDQVRSFRRVGVLGGRSLEKTPSRRLPCQYGGEENVPRKSGS